MTERPKLLTRDQLEALLDHARRVGAPVVDNLRDGLPGAEIDSLMEPLGLVLPEEARTLWGWRDGACTDEMPVIECSLGPPHLYFPTLASNVRLYSEMRELAADIDQEIDPDDYWHPAWLPFTNWGKLAIRCDGSAAPAAPVVDVDWEISPELGRTFARSLGEMFGWWLEAIEDGSWTWDAEKTMWVHQFDVVQSRYPERGGVL